ncbi:MAG: thioesterase [Crocinitomicaceae bacterium]|jgi:acyl-CoA thioester hydrolase|nr:thioesterase [Crocinitomicaceae bacterium]
MIRKVAAMVHNYVVRVRYGETDQMGRVHHAAYLHYLETARIEMLRDSGCSYARIEAEGFLLPVIDLSIQYKGAVLYDDIIEVETTLVKLERVRLSFDYRLLVDKSLVSCARVTLACVSKDTLRPSALPDFVVNAIRGHDDFGA